VIPTLTLIGLALGLGLVTNSAAPVTALAFSPNGRMLVSAGDRQVDLRSATNARVERSIECGLSKICSIAFSPDGRTLAVAGGEPAVRGELLLFAWPSGQRGPRLTGWTDLVTSVAFDSGNPYRLVIGSADHSASVWQAAASPDDDHFQFTNRFQLSGHAGPVLAVTFAPSGQTVVTASADRSLKVWDAADGHLLRSLGHHTEAIHALAFRPASPIQVHGTDPKPASPVPALTCATAGEDRTVRVWQPEIGRMVRIVRGHEGAVFALAWAVDGSVLYSGGQEGIVRRIDGGSDEILESWPAHDDWIYALAMSPDGTCLATGDWQGNVRLRRLH
jgi:WD40 repeat protein